MTIEEALYSKLTATTAITNLVGTRIYPIVADQNIDTLGVDYITYETVYASLVQDHGGASGLRQARIQFNCSSLSYRNAKLIAEALLVVLVGFSGALSGLNIGHILAEEAVDDVDPEARVRIVHQDFHVMYS